MFSTLQCNAEGALALGKGPGGVSWFAIKWNANTIQEARNGALQSCFARGSNCSVTETFRSGCLAIVFGKRGDGASWYNWFVRPIGSAAQNLAMAACRNNGGYCELKGVYCDSVDEAALAAQRLQEQQQAAAAAEQERAAAQAAAERARADAEAELQRAQQAAQEAEQKRIAAEQATAAAESERNAALQRKEHNTSGIPGNDSIFNKPLSQSWPLGLFLLLAFAAIKEIWSARVPRQ